MNQDLANNNKLNLGINGFGRIGKLTLWHHVGRKYFKEIVVNLGRNVGNSLEDIAHYAERDSTYGSLHGFLYGHNSRPLIEEIDEQKSTMRIDDIKVTFLRSSRNPVDIAWKDHDVKIVVDTTGKFLDPTLPPESQGGSVRGHLECGVEKVVVSAPFKIKDKRKIMPEDAVTTVMGINQYDYDPRRHAILSSASCTTTCLAHMMKPLLNHFGPEKILSASMVTVHAVTGSQEVLDRLPKDGATDLRKNRSAMNNIILTSTGAANTLRLVIPEMKKIGFIAESVRIPIVTGSLVILVIDFQEDINGSTIRRDVINQVYRQAALDNPDPYLYYSDQQNVSGDIIGLPKAAVIIEGHETHTRTAELNIDLARVPGVGEILSAKADSSNIRIPITQAVIYGWYDNEMGSYVNAMGDRTVSICEFM
ncbi:MAG: glyceraldehyde-3-phosphate dehydrogenase [Proteobacteria bacterium]|nr:glyceraldehyde-3-phosphate dehydrogenase [Pseudomonadota bacterium]MBU4470394.1 glyceraldehyde-3-phosphate dehydrogenase [Pseudomonadota bacterium]MCG2753929.1 glyceraldehyde-3-phosphate dehydrogenase [Desulfobacteraceae bacterium]